MQRITLQEFYNNPQEILLQSLNIAYLTIHKETEVCYGEQNDCNMEWAEEHNIPVYNTYRGGGTIVCAKGNVGVLLIRDVKYGWVCHKFNRDLLNYLKTKIDDTHTLTINNNDILIDGFKVASGVEMRKGKNLEKIYSTFQISINLDLEVIKHVCKKEMVKVPKALSDFGITTEEIVEFCDEWWDNYKENIINKPL